MIVVKIIVQFWTTSWITSVLIEASEATYVSTVKPDVKKVVGWNKHVNHAHREARSKFLTWTWYGRPRAGSLYEEMCDSRKKFKAKLKWCQQHQEQIKMDIIASLHAKKDFRQFWKRTNMLNGRPGFGGLYRASRHCQLI